MRLAIVGTAHDRVVWLRCGSTGCSEDYASGDEAGTWLGIVGVHVAAPSTAASTRGS